MPYRTKRSYGLRSGAQARALSASRSRSAKFTKKVARARGLATKFTAPARQAKINRKAINTNRRQLRKLTNQLWGEFQEQKSVTTNPITVLANQPALFHVTNPASDQHGPYIHTCDFLTGNHYLTDNHFHKWQGPSDMDNDENDEKHIPNGPKLKLLFADFQFKFHGFVNDTRLRVDFIQQKNITTDFWNVNQPRQFLPNTIPGFANIAGFDPNEIDKKNYRVLKTKYLFMNAAGSSNATDTLQDRDTTSATTPPSKFCHIRLNLNKILKQLDSSLHEVTGLDDQAASVDHTGVGHGGPWRYENQHPLSNIWCLISSDDKTTWDGDHPTVEIIRKMAWRDSRA